MSLKKKAVNGIKWTSLSSIVNAGSQLLLLAILARFINKTDFGLVAIASFVVGFSQLFADVGISNALIHKEKVTKEQLSSLYWLNIATSVAIFLLIQLVAPWIALFYNNIELIEIIRWISLTFIIQPIGSQFAIILQKELNFKSLAITDTLSKTIILVSGCYFGYLGLGAYALVFSNLLGVIVATALLLTFGLKANKPDLHFHYQDVKPFLSFGLFQMGEKMMNYFNTNIDGIVVGKILGLEALGVYNVAKNLVMKPAQIVNPVVTKVSFPVMARFQQDENVLRSIYLRTLTLLSFINFPIFLFMAFFAREIVYFMFGSQWDDAVIVLRILALYSMIRSTANPVGSLQLAKGRADLGFYWNGALLLFIPVSVCIGGIFGIRGVCSALLLLQIALSVPVWRYMVKPLCNTGIKEYYSSFVMPLLVSSISIFSAWALSQTIDFSDPLTNLVLSFFAALSFFFLFNIKYNRPFIFETSKTLRKE